MAPRTGVRSTRVRIPSGTRPLPLMPFGASCAGRNIFRPAPLSKDRKVEGGGRESLPRTGSGGENPATGGATGRSPLRRRVGFRGGSSQEEGRKIFRPSAGGAGSREAVTSKQGAGARSCVEVYSRAEVRSRCERGRGWAACPGRRSRPRRSGYGGSRCLAPTGRGDATHGAATPPHRCAASRTGAANGQPRRRLGARGRHGRYGGRQAWLNASPPGCVSGWGPAPEEPR